MKELEDKFQKRLVVQSNKLIEASYKLKPSQQKFLRVMASMINKDDEDFKTYEFKISQLMELFEVKDQSKYSEIPKQTRELMGNILEFKNDKKIIQVPFLNYCEYEIGHGILKVQFHPYLKPFYLFLGKDNPYTKYELKNILPLKSVYSIRIYELLKQFEKIGQRTIELDNLRELFQIKPNEYKKYNDFKRYVLLQAQKELPMKTDISFDFEEIKEKRKVVAIKFNVNRKNDIHEKEIVIDVECSRADPEEKETPLDSLEKRISNTINIIKDIKIEPSEALSICSAANGDMNLISKAYEYVKSKKKTNNVVGYIIDTIERMKKGTFNEPKSTVKTGFNNFEPRKLDEEYENLQEKVLNGQATDEERERFFKLKNEIYGD